MIVYKKADTVIFVGGLNHNFDTEGKDGKDIKLPYGQDDLIKRLLEIKKDTVLVMLSGAPVQMEQWIDNTLAVLQTWYNVMEGGHALAEVLFGEVNPSGKLPMTFPKALADCPAHIIGEFPGNKTVAYREGIFVGYRYFDTKNIEPRFCFGHGLSYTTFEYSNLEIVKGCKEINVSISIKNTGSIAGAEIVKLYLSDLEASIERPSKELTGFKKVYLKPGETQSFEFKLTERDLSFYNDKVFAWDYEKGEFKVLVGSSIKDIRLEGIFNY